jgi:hypothetical protein
MSSHESERVLVLLKELPMLKELDSESADGSKTESEPDAQRLRQERMEINHEHESYRGFRFRR